MYTLDTAPLRSESPPQKRSGMARVLKGSHSFYLHTHTFIRNRNEPYLLLLSQPQLVLIYRPRRDGRLSRPWCEESPAEIRTHNLPIANPALYHIAASTPTCSGNADHVTLGLGGLELVPTIRFWPSDTTRYWVCRWGLNHPATLAMFCPAFV